MKKILSLALILSALTGNAQSEFTFGTSTQRGLNLKVGERAYLGLTYQHAETVLGNNAKAEESTSDVKTVITPDGANAITMKHNNGIHFYTKTSTSSTTILNTTTYERMRINDNGVFAQQITVQAQTSWPDYVFESNYAMPTLQEIEDFIRTNKHLPGVPSSSEVSVSGINLGKMDAVLLEKIEQLTLLLIEQDKKLRELMRENDTLKNRLDKLEDNQHGQN
ncbi:MAG TPA: hypothetical protein VGD65_20235 [Chryseosolibacter sp.]